MKKILYIGNNLNSKLSNISGIQTLGPLLENEGFVMHYASSKANKILRLLDMVLTCLKLSKKVDVVLIDTYSTQNFCYAVVISQICRFLNINYIPILHGGNLISRLHKNPKLSNLIFQNAKYNVSPSLFLKEAFETEGFRNVIYIPNAIKIVDYPLENKNYEKPNLLWVRSFAKIYNPELAIKVFSKLKDKYPTAKLCMVGPDSDGSRKTIEELVKKLNLSVTIPGKLEKMEWINLAKDYNVFINTTNVDNTPVSVIEAMALGLPVVSTNVGGMPYLIEHNKEGLLVAPNHIEEMSAAIMSILDDSIKRATLIRNAREKVKHFDWDNVKLLWFKALVTNKDES